MIYYKGQQILNSPDILFDISTLLSSAALINLFFVSSIRLIFHGFLKNLYFQKVYLYLEWF